MPDTQKLLIEIIKWGCSLKGLALNYTEATDLMTKDGKVFCVKAVDKIDNKIYEFKSEKVVNASGPWCRILAAKFDKDYPKLFKDSFAWNALFNHPALSSHALAVTPKKPGARTYFIHHWKGLLFAGTVHSPWKDCSRTPMPDENSIKTFIDELNFSIKNLNLNLSDVLQIFPGLLPAKEEGSDKLAVREVIINHAETGGPKGFFSVSGVKFNVDLGNLSRDGRKPLSEQELGIFKNNWIPTENNGWEDTIKNIINDESVVHLDDLMIRRTSLGDNPKLALKYSEKYCGLFKWNDSDKSKEISRLKKFYNSRRISDLDLTN